MNMLIELQGLVRLCRTDPSAVARLLASDLDSAQLEALAAQLRAASVSGRETKTIRFPVLAEVSCGEDSQ